MPTLSDFLEAILNDLNGDLIETRLISTDRERRIIDFHDSVASVARAAHTYTASHPDLNAYFGVCPRACRDSSKSAVPRVPSLWVDLDAKDVPDGKEGALKRLNSFPLEPSAIIDSGNGFHTYWGLKESEEIAGPADIAKAEKYLKGLADALGADRNAAEIARILRIPGTHNVKNPLSPVPVEIISLKPELRYDLSDFDRFRPLTAPRSASTDNSPGWVTSALTELQEGNRNATFAKVVGRLHNERWHPQEIETLLEPHATRCGFPPEELHREVEGICSRYPAKITSPSSSFIRVAMETETKELNPVSLSNFMAQSDDPMEWAVEQVIPKEGLAILASSPGLGKSWMLMDLAIETARGGKWLEYFATTQGRVLYIDEESIPRMLRDRFRQLLSAKEVKADVIDIELAVREGLSFSKPGSVDCLRRRLSELRPSLVIVDSLIRVHDADENSATQMAGVFSTVKDVMAEFGCTLVFADHQRKPGQYETGREHALRGSSDKLAIVDTLLTLTKRKDVRIVHHAKSRCAVPVPSFVLELVDPEPGKTTVTHRGDADDAQRSNRLEAARDFLDDALALGDWVFRKPLVQQAKESGISEKAVDEMLQSLQRAGKVERDERKLNSGRGGKAACYRWTSHSDPTLFLVPPAQEDSPQRNEE